ncbi:MAG: type I phosphomannose isomerase catalytic subunit [Bacilli bacterium]|jgi:mannose-6-phosphate isomerase|nr:mannose-6-phosphate isomerase [Erysipelotrichia bacterium]
MNIKLPHILKLKPHFEETLWGGNNLKKEFNFKVETNQLGEVWLISAHPSGESRLINTYFKSKTLSYVYQNYKQLFSNERGSKFPLLVKFIDAKKDLSVQVHPNDEYALKHEKQKGKSEAWIILNKAPNTRILIGHNAKTKEELTSLINKKNWDELLTYRELNKHEIINIPSGTVHAICEGTTLLEIQQSSDVTYRLYDYDRLDKNNNLRPLHLEKAIDVINVPHEHEKIQYLPTKQNYNEIHKLLLTKYFSISSLKVNEKYRFINNKSKYYLVVILDGVGKIAQFKAKKGDSFIVTSLSKTVLFQGDLNLIIAKPE